MDSIQRIHMWMNIYGLIIQQIYTCIGEIIKLFYKEYKFLQTQGPLTSFFPELSKVSHSLPKQMEFAQLSWGWICCRASPVAVMMSSTALSWQQIHLRDNWANSIGWWRLYDMVESSRKKKVELDKLTKNSCAHFWPYALH